MLLRTIKKTICVVEEEIAGCGYFQRCVKMAAQQPNV